MKEHKTHISDKKSDGEEFMVFHLYVKKKKCNIQVTPRKTEQNFFGNFPGGSSRSIFESTSEELILFPVSPGTIGFIK